MLCASSCTGDIGDGGGENSPSGAGKPWSGGGDVNGPGGSGDPSDPAAPGNGGSDPAAGGGDNGNGDPGTAGPISHPNPTLRRLTPEQYRNSVHDLIGVEPDISELPAIPPLNGLTAIGAATVALSELDLEGFETQADTAASDVFGDAGLRLSLLGCDAAEAGCTPEFIARFGRRAFRRPLSADELSRYGALAERAAELTGDPWIGARFALSAMLQSPHFLYRVEIGVADPADATRRLLTDYELATRLSFLLWNTTPDDELLDAAEQKQLTSGNGLGDQAQRLLASQRARDAIEDFYAAYLALDGLDHLDKLPEAYPQISDTLGAAMRQETLRTLVGLTIDDEADFRTAFTTKRTFLDAELADLYGVAAPSASGFASHDFADDSPRAGLLTQGAFLALQAHQAASSPTRRGKFIRESLLCQGIPPPPPDVDTSLPDASEAPTARERLAMHRENDACSACHALMDPIGLALENFDGIGAHRTTENGERIDASGELDGVAFDDAQGLGEALSQHPGLVSCLTRTLLRQARGALENRSETPIIDSLSGEFADAGHRVPDLLLALVASDAFREVGALDDGSMP